jgi:hypothetical protein
MMEQVTLPTDTRINYYNGQVDEDGIFVLGYPFSSKNVQVDTLLIDSIYTPVDFIDFDDD